jgi:hypothetical protein
MANAHELIRALVQGHAENTNVFTGKVGDRFPLRRHIMVNPDKGTAEMKTYSADADTYNRHESTLTIKRGGERRHPPLIGTLRTTYFANYESFSEGGGTGERRRDVYWVYVDNQGIHIDLSEEGETHH